MRFDLKLAWLLMSNACVLVWASMGDALIPPIIFLFFVGFTSASYAAVKRVSPLLWASIGGTIAIVLLAICVFPVRAAIYLSLSAPPDYFEDLFEDGMTATFVTYPIVLAIIYAPVGLGIGFICGAIVQCIHRVVAMTWSRSNT